MHDIKRYNSRFIALTLYNIIIICIFLKHNVSGYAVALKLG